MAGQALHTEAFVLVRRPTTADGWQAFTLFAPEHGPLHVLQRIPKKPGTSVALDLFDEISAILESSNQGRTWFVREARVKVRHAEIGRSYAALQGASAFALLIARNSVSPDSRPAVAALLRTGLAAFASAARPEIVAFKCLYRFARDEGYPVKQEWLPSLPAEERTAAEGLINRPLAAQTAGADAVARIQRNLEDYLRGHTEIIVNSED